LRLTFDKSPVRERRTPGPVRGARGNSRLYRDRLSSTLHENDITAMPQFIDPPRDTRADGPQSIFVCVRYR
jgi:hypothetical protein